ncbi:hypothetical protein CSC89_00055 [Klebsiella pneumoniae]|nr:hypothetical protein BME39_22520 [Klebsiella quasipneumoniae subsp. similipneumoniae]PPJ82874.1 hypothetical protein CSC93_27330 [Klebsiella pneumoniae]PPK07658.1 hypothetical protein CSC89_00055 [Klebsiella pneumoniae]
MLPVLPDCRPVCGEPVRSGAGKRCYGKCERCSVFLISFTSAKNTKRKALCIISMMFLLRQYILKRN